MKANLFTMINPIKGFFSMILGTLWGLHILNINTTDSHPPIFTWNLFVACAQAGIVAFVVYLGKNAALSVWKYCKAKYKLYIKPKTPKS